MRDQPSHESPSPDPSQEPSPEASPSPSPGAKAPGEGSSTGSSTGSPFVSNPGADFAGGHERPGFEGSPEPEPEVLDFGWEEDSVRSILEAKGSAIHALAGVAERDWKYTRDDLDAIAPPLTRILNRYPATRAAAGTGDELAVMIGLGGYASRSWIERSAAIAAAEDEPEVPSSGRAAEGAVRQPGAPPPPSPEAAEADWNTGE